MMTTTQRVRSALPPAAALPAGATTPGYARLYWLGVAAQVAAAVVMLIWTWGAWPDPLVDFGRELYIPWQLAAGKALYRDIAYFNGPLSPYVNALWFRLFGASLWTLIWANLTLLTLLCVLLQRLLLAIGDRLAAVAAGLVLVLVLAFSHYMDTGNYNYVCPYSHELPHGLLLAVLGLWALHVFQRTGRPAAVCVLGLTLGLSFLTKPEVFLAAAVAIGSGLTLTLWKTTVRGRPLARVVVCLAAGTLLPILVAVLLLCRTLPASDALRATLGAWPVLADTRLTQSPFYRQVLGTDAPGRNVAAMLGYGAAVSAVGLLVILLALRLRLRGARRVAWIAGTAALLTGVVAPLWLRIPWFDLPRALPLVLVVVVAVALWRTLFAVAARAETNRAILQFSIALFALLLLAKMLLNARIYHYGFALAMPGALLAVVLVVSWIPRWIDRRGGTGGIFTAAALAVLAVGTFAHLRIANMPLREKTVRVGTGANAFRAGKRGIMINDLLGLIGNFVPPGRTLAVLPEGVMLNFLSGHVNSTPFIVFMPPELMIFGEARIVAAFERNPPDYVLLLHRQTPEYGVRFFGRDYGCDLKAWIDDHYQPVQLLGAMPLQGEHAGALLLRRNDL